MKRKSSEAASLRYERFVLCRGPTRLRVSLKKDFPDSVRVSRGDSPEAVLMRGGSAIANPPGQDLAGPHFGGETILTADLDLNDIARGKFDFDIAGHYNRPDVFQLSINEAPMRPASSRS